MLGMLKNLFSPMEAPDLTALMREGAQIVDVRTPEEFHGAHVRGAVNIPVQVLQDRLSGLRKDRPIITCCASGMRSAAAKRILESKGFERVHNGGGWRALESRLR